MLYNKIMATTTNTTKTWNSNIPAGDDVHGYPVHTEGFEYFVTVSGTAGCAGAGEADCGPGHDGTDFLLAMLGEQECAA